MRTSAVLLCNENTHILWAQIYPAGLPCPPLCHHHVVPAQNTPVAQCMLVTLCCGGPRSSGCQDSLTQVLLSGTPAASCTSPLLNLLELPGLKDASFPELGVLWGQPALGVTPPGQAAPAAGLEANDDVRDLQVPLLLQVGQHARPEKDLALAHAVQVALELQGFDPEEESQLLTPGHPSHHRALEQGKAREGAWSLGCPCCSVGSLLLVQGEGDEGMQAGTAGG